MPERLTIIMYHYVRDMFRSRYPEIKGLTIREFRNQLEYIRKFFNVISAGELLDSIGSQNDLPRNAALLTFDDGYLDHYAYVFPILDEIKMPACFFPPAAAIEQHKVLDVNKIHFVLASVQDKALIIKDIFDMLDVFREGYSLKKNDEYYAKLAVANRFDTAEVIFIKRILQAELPEDVRGRIIDDLFGKFVTRDESAFSQELYMNVAQLRCMQRHGMYIGAHGYNHYWLDHLSEERQEEEIDLSLDFLRTLECDVGCWIMCYPYGAYNQSLLNLLKLKGCKAGLTTRVDLARLDIDDLLMLPRLDTNDLPKEAGAQPNDWTLKAIAAF